MKERRSAVTSDEAHALANRRRLFAEDDPDPAVVEKMRLQAKIERIARDAPAVRTAFALLDLHLIFPVPLDGNLEPAGPPLETADAVLDWYRQYEHDDHAVGISTGPHPHRPWSYLAVKVDTFAAWFDWLRDKAAVRITEPDLGGFADWGSPAEVGPPKERIRTREPGPFSRLVWTPPPFRMKLRQMDATGQRTTDEANDRTVGRGGWIWLAIPGQVEVSKDRRIASGVKALKTGTVVPWDGSRLDGWTLRVTAAPSSSGGLQPPRAAPLADWLVEALTR